MNAFNVDELLKQLPDLPNPPAEDQLVELSRLMGHYYKQLRVAGVPIDLADALVREMHNFVVWKND